MKIFKYGIPALFATLCTACAQPSVEPPFGMTGSLVFDNQASGRMSVAMYDHADDCSGRRTLPALATGEQKHVVIPAGSPLVFEVRQSGIDYTNAIAQESCAFLPYFTPEPDEDYIATVTLDLPGHRCRLTLSTAVQTGQIWQARQAVPYLARSLVVPVATLHPHWCNALQRVEAD
ncbi:MAG: hypothetical protein P4L83_01245 [Nevskia sp.]|nr:hypothetical protein [Nevskia sp.]